MNNCSGSSRSVKFAVLNAHSICNKTSGTLNLLKHHNIDICLITETWLKADDKAKFAEVHERGLDIFSKPRRGNGGGVGFIFDPKRVRLVRNNVNGYSSFEVLEAVFKADTDLFRLCVVYRTTQTKSSKTYQQTRLKNSLMSFLSI